MPPTVFPATRSADWYRTHLFARQPGRKFLMQNLPSGDIWKDSRIVGAVTLCSTRPLDRITVPQGDTYLLERLCLTHLGGGKNRTLAQQLREMP